MNNRIDITFKELKEQGRKAFIAYVTAGDPSLSFTEKCILELGKSGVDMVEIGVPFYDPLADGGTIQAASKRALERHITLPQIFAMVKRLRKHTQMPLLLMTYYNPVFHFGPKRFVDLCQENGVDGVIIPDLPPEEAGDLRTSCKEKGINTVFFISPTTQDERIIKNAQASSGFIYYVAITGVTGNIQAQSSDVIKAILHAKKFTNKPICAGFGISTPEQVKAISKIADGVIVGSAIVSKINQYAKDPHGPSKVGAFVKTLTRVLAA